MDSRAVRQEVAEFCHYIYGKRYTQAPGGSLSRRVPGTKLVAIKETAANIRVMTDADILIMDMGDNVIYGDGKPSREAGFHLSVLKLHPGMNTFTRCHPDYSIALANDNIELPFTSVTARKVVGRVPFVESAPADNKSLHWYVIDAFQDHPESKEILMKEHGICAMDPSLEAAYNVVDLIEQTVKQACIQVQAVVNKNKFRGLFRM